MSPLLIVLSTTDSDRASCDLPTKNGKVKVNSEISHNITLRLNLEVFRDILSFIIGVGNGWLNGRVALADQNARGPGFESRLEQNGSDDICKYLYRFPLCVS